MRKLSNRDATLSSDATRHLVILSVDGKRVVQAGNPQRLRMVDAPTVLDAAHAALAKFAPTLTAPSIWLRVVVTTHPNGVPRQVLSVPLTATRQMPLDWSAPLLEGQ